MRHDVISAGFDIDEIIDRADYKLFAHITQVNPTYPLFASSASTLNHCSMSLQSLTKKTSLSAAAYPICTIQK